MIIKMYNENTNERHVRQVVDILEKGGVIIYPTDTVYAIGCNIMNPKAVEKVAKMKGLSVEKTNFSMISHDLSHLSDYTKPINNHIFKLMKKNLPGPFTFILDANNNLPRYFKGKKKTVGIRVPDNAIITSIVRELQHPILSTSIKDDDEVLEYTTDPELIYERYKDWVDCIIDGGFGGNTPSTVIDCTNNNLEIVREGKGDLLE